MNNYSNSDLNISHREKNKSYTPPSVPKVSPLSSTIFAAIFFVGSIFLPFSVSIVLAAVGTILTAKGFSASSTFLPMLAPLPAVLICLFTNGYLELLLPIGGTLCAVAMFFTVKHKGNKTSAVIASTCVIIAICLILFLGFMYSSYNGISADDFVTELLCGELGCVAAIAGRDFRFGHRAAGDITLLMELMAKAGGECIIADDVIMHKRKISTTEIKRLMGDGDIAEANEMLGAPFFLEAVVEHGRGVGRTLGFPTVNCPLKDKQGLLKRGVYISKIVTRGGSYPALTNVGVCPTFDARPEHAESFILDFDGDIYGERVRIIPISYLRPEIKFDTPDKLMEQVNNDIKKAKEVFENGR